ncbi:hypothetical protein CAter10_3966 [Collimonas arenae]|nr:hypothetical protein CAter10_3966 [Collimonas arenae]
MSVGGGSGGGANDPRCINSIGADGKPHCLQYSVTGVAVRRWRQLSIKPN